MSNKTTLDQITGKFNDKKPTTVILPERLLESLSEDYVNHFHDGEKPTSLTSRMLKDALALLMLTMKEGGGLKSTQKEFPSSDANLVLFKNKLDKLLPDPKKEIEARFQEYINNDRNVPAFVKTEEYSTKTTEKIQENPTKQETNEIVSEYDVDPVVTLDHSEFLTLDAPVDLEPENKPINPFVFSEIPSEYATDEDEIIEITGYFSI